MSEGTKYCKSSKILRGKGKKFGKGKRLEIYLPFGITNRPSFSLNAAIMAIYVQNGVFQCCFIIVTHRVFACDEVGHVLKELFC